MSHVYLCSICFVCVFLLGDPWRWFHPKNVHRYDWNPWGLAVATPLGKYMNQWLKISSQRNVILRQVPPTPDRLHKHPCLPYLHGAGLIETWWVVVSQQVVAIASKYQHDINYTILYVCMVAGLVANWSCCYMEGKPPGVRPVLRTFISQRCARVWATWCLSRPSPHLALGGWSRVHWVDDCAPDGNIVHIHSYASCMCHICSKPNLLV